MDEAGRGALLGPLVIAGVAIKKPRLDELKRIGVRDSKQLSPTRRERLYPIITSMADKVEVVEITPQEIDSRSKHGYNLNQLELLKMAQISLKLGVGEIFVDAVDVDERRFCVELTKRAPNTVFICEHEADSKYTVTSAASIVAKVTRDRRISELKKIYGEVGSGYPSDPRTISFVREYYVKTGAIPEFARRTWKTLRRTLKEG
ncbi:MAG: ribonuclease HII [Thermoprotei archaeon]